MKYNGRDPWVALEDQECLNEFVAQNWHSYIDYCEVSPIKWGQTIEDYYVKFAESKDSSFEEFAFQYQIDFRESQAEKEWESRLEK